MKTNLGLYSIGCRMAFVCLIVLLAACSRDNDITIPETHVNKLEPMTVHPGETLTLTGENMHLISKVYFGDGTTVDIATAQDKRDHSSLSVLVPIDVFEQTETVKLLVLYNSVHRLVVCEEFTIEVGGSSPGGE